MLNWLLRYQPVMRVLDDLQPRSVLDVGAGSHGLSLYWAGHVVQTDLTFAPPPDTRVGSASLVAASAEALPFSDAAFDTVVSIDMVEHLPAEIREQSIAELFRVADRAVIVAYPIGRVAARADKVYAAALRMRRIEVPPWLAEHLGQAEYPSSELLRTVLPQGWQVSRTEREHNVWLQLAVALAETTRMRKVTERIEKWGLRHQLPRPLKIGGSYRWFFLAERVPH